MRITKENLIKLRYYKVFDELFKGKYKKLNSDERIIYGMIIRRTDTSIKNNWFNEKGEVYVNLKRKSVCFYMNLSPNTVKKCYENLKNIELIDFERVFNNQADRIYPHNIEKQIGEQLEMQIIKEDNEFEKETREYSIYIEDSESLKKSESKKAAGIEKIKSNINYENNIEILTDSLESASTIEEIEREENLLKIYKRVTEVLFETFTSNKVYNINGNQIKAREIKERFLELTEKEIWASISGLINTDTTTKHYRGYIVSTLFNSEGSFEMKEIISKIQANRDFSNWDNDD